MRLRSVLAVLTISMVSTATFAAGKPIVLDVDPGIDDAIAIPLVDSEGRGGTGVP